MAYQNPTQQAQSAQSRIQGQGEGSKAPLLDPNDPREKQRGAIGISSIHLSHKIPPGTSKEKAILFEKVDNAILQGLELVDYLEKAVEEYKAHPYPINKSPNKVGEGVYRNRPSKAEITEHVDVALANAFALRDGIDRILRDHSGDKSSKLFSSFYNNNVAMGMINIPVSPWA